MGLADFVGSREGRQGRIFGGVDDGVGAGWVVVPVALDVDLLPGVDALQFETLGTTYLLANVVVSPGHAAVPAEDGIFLAESFFPTL